MTTQSEGQIERGDGWVCFHGCDQREPCIIPDRALPCPSCGWSLPCDHVWVRYAAGEPADATLSAPAGTATFSEAVQICAVCSLIQPDAGGAR